MEKLENQKTSIYKTNEVVGLEFVKDAERKYVIFCDNHQTYMYGQYKKELLETSTLEFCFDCRGI